MKLLNNNYLVWTTQNRIKSTAILLLVMLATIKIGEKITADRLTGNHWEQENKHVRGNFWSLMEPMALNKTILWSKLDGI